MASFDAIARSYDQLWTMTAVGDVQRRAVWKFIDPLFQAGGSVLDLGCGTGVDAVHLQETGVQVYGIDSSPEMIGIAKRKGVDAHVCGLEDLATLRGSFDGAISNFGALNCLASVSSAAKELARLIRSGGFVALCFLGRICLWEIAYYSLRGSISKAVRRLSGCSHSSFGIEVFYPTRRSIVRAFQNDFVLCANSGVGLTVPPSYVTGLGQKPLETLAALDERLAVLPLFRSFSDHQLYIWRRL
jgi:ubiquinone/menaquinone biosynthesis C-methylase UbiE